MGGTTVLELCGRMLLIKSVEIIHQDWKTTNNGWTQQQQEEETEATEPRVNP